MKYLIILLFALISCYNKSVEDEILTRIEKYYKYKNEYFKDMNIRTLREIYRPKTLDFKVRRVGNNNYALIQTKPERFIYKNFYEDSINMEFVNVFAEMECRKLYNHGDFEFFVFRYKKLKVTVFKGIPNYINFHYDTNKGIKIIDDWKYIIEDFK